MTSSPRPISTTFNRSHASLSIPLNTTSSTTTAQNHYSAMKTHSTPTSSPAISAPPYSKPLAAYPASKQQFKQHSKTTPTSGERQSQSVQNDPTTTDTQLKP